MDCIAIQDLWYSCCRGKSFCTSTAVEVVIMVIGIIWSGVTFPASRTFLAATSGWTRLPARRPSSSLRGGSGVRVSAPRGPSWPSARCARSRPGRCPSLQINDHSRSFLGGVTIEKNNWSPFCWDFEAQQWKKLSFPSLLFGAKHFCLLADDVFTDSWQLISHLPCHSRDRKSLGANYIRHLSPPTTTREGFGN